MLLNREEAIKYANKIINFTVNTDNDIQSKRFVYLILFDMYIYQKDYIKAKDLMHAYTVFLKDIARFLKDDLESEIAADYIGQKVIYKRFQDLNTINI